MTVVENKKSLEKRNRDNNMVKISFLDKDDLVNRFYVENIDSTTLNAIRRTINFNLPVYAIDEIDFIENDSVVVDEMLANRLALCPISTPVETTGKKVTFTLEKKGPGVVYSGDLISNDSEVKMVYDNIPLTKLRDTDKINLVAYAVLGKGTDHAKFNSTIVGYQQMCELEVLRGCDSCQKCVDACPVKNIKLVSGKPKIEDPIKCINCQACVDACPKNCLKLNDIDNYILTIELIGQMDILSIIKTTERYSKEYFMLLKKKFK